MNNKLLSIIVPVYNVEKYIDNCLSSIFKQKVDSSKFEVIIVNDGTKDSSMNTVYKYAEEYDNLHIIEQANQGLSVARNRGISCATGDYVWCVDSDDWIDINSIKNIIDTILFMNSDIIAILIDCVEEELGKHNTVNFSDTLVGRNLFKGSEYLFSENRITPTQKYVYRRQFLIDNCITYFPQVLHEDTDYCLRALFMAKDVFLLKKICYYYLIRKTGSITSSYGPKNFKDLFVIFEKLTEFEIDNIFNKRELRLFRYQKVMTIIVFMLRAMAVSNFRIENPEEFKKIFKYLRPIINRNIWRILQVKWSCKYYYKICFLYYFYPKLLFAIFKKEMSVS